MDRLGVPYRRRAVNCQYGMRQAGVPLGFPPRLRAAPKRIPGAGAGSEEAGQGGIPRW